MKEHKHVSGECCHCHEEHHHEEHHHEEHSCACGHEHSDISLSWIISGAFIFVLALILEHIFKTNALIVFVFAYAVLGYKVLYHAFKNILKGRVLDENFLMSISSLAAFFIGSYSEAVAVMLFYNIGEYFQGKAVSKSKKSIADLMDICEDSANVIRNGEIFKAACENVKVGEEILIKPGEKIPLDGVVLMGQSELDTSALTGESMPKTVKENDEVLSGCINKDKILKIRVTKPFSESTASKIVKLTEEASSKKARMEQFITRVSRVYTPVVVILALLISLIPALIWGDFSEWIRRGCVFLVISCPCALVISIPLTFFGGIGAASKRGILVKGTNFLEALSKINTVVFDKTGTLTKGSFEVSRIIPENGFSEEEVLELAAKAESISNHPIAVSVVKKAGISNVRADEAKEIVGFGVESLFGNDKIVVGNEKLLKKHGAEFRKYDGDEAVVYVLKNGEYIGCIVISDEIKDGTEKAVMSIKRSGINVAMLTGDLEKNALSISKKLGIDEVYASLLPDEKIEKFEQIKNRTNGITVFVGDGINDAPVISRADVGIAMGGLGSDVAIEAADVVIMNDEPLKITEAIRISKKTRKIVIQNIVFALGIKVLFLILGAFGIATMWEAVFGDVGVMVIAVLNSARILKGVLH